MKSIVLFLNLIFLSTAFSQAFKPKLLDNVNKDEYGSESEGFTVLQGKLFFSASSSIYISDGTSQGTHYYSGFPTNDPKDVSSVKIIDTVNNKLLIQRTIYSPLRAELWTISIDDSIPKFVCTLKNNESANHKLGRINGRLVLKEYSANEFLITDASSSGTFPLGDIKGMNPISPRNIIPFKDSFYYIDYKFNRSCVLRTSGEDNSTELVMYASDLMPIHNSRITSFGDKLYAASDSIVWSYDYNTKSVQKLLQQDYLSQFLVIGEDSIVFIGRNKGEYFGLKAFYKGSFITLEPNISLDTNAAFSEFLGNKQYVVFIKNDDIISGSYCLYDFQNSSYQILENYSIGRLPLLYNSILYYHAFNEQIMAWCLYAYNPLSKLKTQLNRYKPRAFVDQDFAGYKNNVFLSMRIDSTGWEPYYITTSNQKVHLLKNIFRADYSSYANHYVAGKDYILFTAQANSYSNSAKLMRVKQSNLFVDSITLASSENERFELHYNQYALNDSFINFSLSNLDQNKACLYSINYHNKAVKLLNQDLFNTDYYFIGKVNNKTIGIVSGTDALETVFWSSNGRQLLNLQKISDRYISKVGQSLIYKDKLLTFVKFMDDDSFELFVSDGSIAGTYFYNQKYPNRKFKVQDAQLLKVIGDNIYFTSQADKSPIWKIRGQDFTKSVFIKDNIYSASDTGYSLNGKNYLILKKDFSYNFYEFNGLDTVLSPILLYTDGIGIDTLDDVKIHNGFMWFVASRVGGGSIIQDIWMANFAQNYTVKSKSFTGYNDLIFHGLNQNYLVYTRIDTLYFDNKKSLFRIPNQFATVNGHEPTYVSDSMVYFLDYTDSLGYEPYTVSLPNTPNFFGINTNQIKKQNDLLLYPNPSHNLLQIKSKSSEIIEYAVYNINGDEVLNNTINQASFECSININSFSNGVYTVVAKLKNGSVQVAKFIKS